MFQKSHLRSNHWMTDCTGVCSRCACLPHPYRADTVVPLQYALLLSLHPLLLLLVVVVLLLLSAMPAACWWSSHPHALWS
jgi:hypothetical protein